MLLLNIQELPPIASEQEALSVITAASARIYLVEPIYQWIDVRAGHKSVDRILTPYLSTKGQ